MVNREVFVTYALRRSVGPLSAGTRVTIMEDRGKNNVIVKTLSEIRTIKDKHGGITKVESNHIAVACTREDLVILRKGTID